MTDDGSLLVKVLAAALIFLFGIAGAAASRSLRNRSASHWLSVGNCFAGGIFIGAGLIHTLADSAGLFTELYPDMDFPIWAALAGLAIVLLMWIDKSASRGSNGRVGGATLFLVLSIHSLLAGMALGVEAHPAQAIAILIAIVAHKGSAAFALGLRSTEAHYWRRMTAFALMTPIGVVIGTGITLLLQSQSEQRFEAVFDAIAAGTFLYVALSEILPGELEDNEHVHRAMISTVAGLLLMAVLALYT